MSKHLGAIYRSIDSAHLYGWDLLVLRKDDLDFSGTSDLPACGTGKEIELLWGEVDRNRVMVNVPAGSCCPRAGAEARWTGGSGWDGSRSTGASQGLEPTLLEERMGAKHWLSPEKGRPSGSLQTPGGEEEEALSQLCTGLHSAQRLG